MALFPVVNLDKKRGYEDFEHLTSVQGLDDAGNFSVTAGPGATEIKRRSGIAGLRGWFETGSISHQIFLEGALSDEEGSRRR